MGVKIKATLLKNWREVPGNVVGVSLLSMWMLCTARVLFVTATRPVTSVFAHGPGALLPASVWAVIFLCFGLLRLVELIVASPWATFFIQTMTSIPIFFWAVCWMFGVATPGQPAYIFVALISITLPFVTRINRANYNLQRSVPPAGIEPASPD